MINPNRQYRTRDGRAVRIYATDGHGAEPIHGAVWLADRHGNGYWKINAWKGDGSNCTIDGRVFGATDPGPHSWLNLIEVTLADELRDQIPWSALRPKYQWVAMSSPHEGNGFEPTWKAFKNKPYMDGLAWKGNNWTVLTAVAMPEVDPARWRETLVERPLFRRGL